uniref:Gag-Pol polyprotein n=1 Tax=Tanacetum cinerariifolium TaxID=118510 RepID=A0A6L2MYK3_TANCI|nr:hypothetical protein [Tanacetum cinerariifolium]
MSNTNLHTQTSNALYNAIMEAGGKDRPPMLAPDNYVQWKSIIKRYIDTKPNNELIHYCLQNTPNKFKWTKKIVPVAKGSLETTIEGYMENYKKVSQDIRNQLSQPAATRNRGQEIVNSPLPTYDQEPTMVAEDDEMLKKKEIDNTLRINRGTWYDNQRVLNVAGAKENVADWRDANDDEPDDQELEAHYLYMVKSQEVTSDAV